MAAFFTRPAKAEALIAGFLAVFSHVARLSTDKQSAPAFESPLPYEFTKESRAEITA